MRDFTSAFQSHKFALDVRFKLFDENHLDTVESYCELGNTQLEIEDFPCVLQSHQHALDVRVRLLGENTQGQLSATTHLESHNIT